MQIIRGKTLGHFLLALEILGKARLLRVTAAACSKHIHLAIVVLLFTNSHSWTFPVRLETRLTIRVQHISESSSEVMRSGMHSSSRADELRVC